MNRILITLFIAITLSSCSQEAIKPEDNSRQENKKTSNNKLTKADRDKYRSGITALNNDELSKAQRIFIEFIRAKPELAGGYSNLALVFLKQNKKTESLKSVNKALQLNPVQAQALNLRAQLYILDGKIHQAEKDYLLAIKVKPEYINAHYNIALLYDIYFQDINQAIKHYKIYMSLLKTPDEKTQEWITHLEGALNES